MLDQLNEQLNRSPLAVTFAGGVSGFVYRFLAYSQSRLPSQCTTFLTILQTIAFLRWIPGRQGYTSSLCPGIELELELTLPFADQS